MAQNDLLYQCFFCKTLINLFLGGLLHFEEKNIEKSTKRRKNERQKWFTDSFLIGHYGRRMHTWTVANCIRPSDQIFCFSKNTVIYHFKNNSNRLQHFFSSFIDYRIFVLSIFFFCFVYKHFLFTFVWNNISYLLDSSLIFFLILVLFVICWFFGNFFLFLFFLLFLLPLFFQ